MKRLLFSFAMVCAIVVTGLLVTSDRDSHERFGQQYAKLERQLKHAKPGSGEAVAVQMKLEKLEEAAEGRPEADAPDIFAQILYEMKIPSDRTEPEYRAGYRARELKKAPRQAWSVDKSLTWTARGPGNVAGRARGILVDPDDTTGLTWFIAAVGGGVWKTADGGSTWQVLTDGLPDLAFQSLAMAASDHDVIYAGTGESFFNVDTLNGNGIFKSTDRGATWTQLASTMDDPRFNNVSRIIVSPTDPDLVLASTTTGTYKQSLNGSSSIFRSTDGGATWTEVYNTLQLQRVNQVDQSQLIHKILMCI